MSLLQSVVLLGLAASAQLASAQRGGPPSGPPANVPARPPNFVGGGQSAGSPTYNYIFQYPVPIPPIATPISTQTINGKTVQFFETTIQPFQQQVYPNLGPANLVGYNGTAPGPTYYIQKGTETIIRYLNNGTKSAAVHLHGSYTHSAWDGWASDELQPGQWKDYYYPNSESARPMWYHDHAQGHTADDAYYGQAGVYIIYDPAENSLGLPTGKYDVPLALNDKIYQSNGDLASPDGSPINFFGDTIQVNDQPWPYMAVEPRKYRLRFFDMSLSRPYDLYFADSKSNVIPFQVIASDSGLFGSPVTTKDVTIAMGERYEVVFDFSAYKGQNITLMNGLQQTQISQFNNTDKVMRFVVGNTVTDNTNNGAVPSTLANIPWPANRQTVDHAFNFQLGGENTWTINGVDFSDVNNRVLARPPQGTVERWSLHHTGGPAVHPVHIHLVNMQVVSRTGGARGLLPYEAAGLKDVVMLAPGETVEVLAIYGPWNGMYMFHCHNLIHEDHEMLDVFNVTRLAALGYNSTAGYGNPEASNFAAQSYNPSAYAPAAISSVIASYVNLNAYAPVTSLIAAESAYYATAGYNGDLVQATTTTTAAPISSGDGVNSTAQPTSTALFGRDGYVEARATLHAQPFVA